MNQPITATQSALSIIAAERRRQVEELGYTAEKDDLLADGQLEDKAVDYIDSGYTSDSTHITHLTKAGALIVAEIERLQRKGEK